MSRTFYKETPVESEPGEPMFLFCVYDLPKGSAFSCCTLQQGKMTEYETACFEREDVEKIAQQVLHYANYRTGCVIKNGFPGNIRHTISFGDSARAISQKKFSSLQDNLKEAIDSRLVTVATS